MDDAGFEEDEGDGGDAAAIRFEGTIAPYVVSFESTARRSASELRKGARKGEGMIPHAEHIDEMLFGDIVLAIDVTLESGEDARSGEEGISAIDLELKESLIRQSSFIRGGFVVGGGGGTLRGDGEVLEFFAEDDDGLFVKEGVLEIGLIGREGVG